MSKVYITIALVLDFYIGMTQISHFEALGYDKLPISGLGNWTVSHNDFDNDGDIDLFIGRSFQQDILLKNNGNGHFTEISSSGDWETPGGSFDALCIDLNNDGLKDIIIARGPESGASNLLPGHNQIIISNGNGSFYDATTNLPTIPIDDISFSMGVGTGDFNNDGINDLIFANGGINYLPNIEYFKSFNLALKNQILQNDLYLGESDSDGDGIINFVQNSVPSGIGSNIDMSTDVAVADFDNDGLDDIFVTNFHDAGVNNFPIVGLSLTDTAYFSKLYLNNSSNPGNFTWNLSSFPLIKYPATSVDAADFDGDGDIDLLIGMEKRADSTYSFPVGVEYSPSMTSKIFLNDGNANFSDATLSVFPPFKPEYLSSYDIRFVDFNNDGWLDVYGAGITSFLFIQDDTVNHTFVDKTYLLPLSQAHPTNNITHTYHTYGADFADFDNNGKTDAILACTYEQLHLLFQAANGKFIDTTTTNLPPDGQNTEYAVIADFTGDNLPDVVKVNNDITVNTHAFYIQTSQINNHAYFIDKGYQIPLGTNFTKNYGVDCNDIDNDSDYDVLIAGESGIKIYENDGFGNFTENTTWLADISGVNNSTRVKFVDVDGDGDKDIFVPRAQNLTIGESNKLLLRNGSSYIDATSSLFPSNLNPSLDVDFYDINGDGWMDFIVANANGGGTLYLSNNGGMYSTSTPFTALSGSTSLKFIQLDSDTLVDVIQVNKNHSENAMIYKNAGSNPFYSTSIAIANSNEESYDVNFYDFNSDGLNDLLIAGFAETNRIFINNGNMNFTDSTAIFFPDAALRTGSFTKAVALDDIDQDGLIDIYLVRDNQDLLLYGQGSTTGLSELTTKQDNSIHLFPNPAKDYFTIDTERFEEVNDLIILSYDGKIAKIQNGLSDNTINIKDLEQGLYFVVVKHGNEHYSVGKLIKTK